MERFLGAQLHARGTDTVWRLRRGGLGYRGPRMWSLGGVPGGVNALGQIGGGRRGALGQELLEKRRTKFTSLEWRHFRFLAQLGLEGVTAAGPESDFPTVIRYLCRASPSSWKSFQVQ